MRLYGKEYSVSALRKRVGNMDQVAGIQMVTLADGNERPARAAILRTGGGLEVTVLIDRGMDIASACHNGRAMGWRSTTGSVAPQYYEAEGIRWLRSYFGGLMTTCGLSRVGGPGPDSALQGDGLHGREADELIGGRVAHLAGLAAGRGDRGEQAFVGVHESSTSKFWSS